MTDSLRVLFVLVPVLGWWLLLGSAGTVFAVGGAFVMNNHARQLVLDLRLALDRADHSIDFASRCTEVTQPRLSDQLRGVSPATSMWRLFAADELYASAFEDEYLAIRAQRRGLVLVRADLGAILTRLDDLLIGPKPMAKATLAPAKKAQVSA